MPRETRSSRVIAVVSDTHRETEHGLDGRALAAVREADLVCHAGDFTTPAVYGAFRKEAARLEAVHGNSDDPELRERLPATRVIPYEGVRIVLVHGHEHSGTALSLLARQEDADLVISGHTHRPRARRQEGRLFLDPGSHATPRGNRRAHAEVEIRNGRVETRLYDANGDVFESIRSKGEG